MRFRFTIKTWRSVSSFLLSLREPLRDGAPSVPEQAAQLHHPPFNCFLVSNPCKEPYELSPKRLRSKGSFLTTSLCSPSSLQSLSLIVCVAALSKKKKDKRTIEEKKGPNKQRSWGATFAEGLRTMGNTKCNCYIFVHRMLCKHLSDLALFVTD
jgi:hypothetical protein